MAETAPLTCFASHRCGAPQHAFLECLSTACERAGVRLDVDGFDPGLHVQTRMESIIFDSFVFLSEPASWASPACQTELRTARIRRVPVVTIRFRGDVPTELRDRVFVDVEGLSGEAEAAAVQALASIVSARAGLHRQILRLDAPADPATPWVVAESLAERADAALLAEEAGHLAVFYRPDVHPATRYWLALAIGRAGTPEAGAILDRFSWETHPYPLRGIRDARRMLGA